jgi:phosphoribosylformylglycinamidine synthase
MVLAVPSQHLAELLEICAIEEVEASIVGTFTDNHRLVVTYSGQIVADMDMEFLHSGCPRRTLEAVWTPEQHVANQNVATQSLHSVTRSLAPTLLSLLRHPTLASKEDIVRRYDHEVQGATVLKPLVGKAGNGPGDAAVLQPILDEQTRAGIVLSNGVNPLYGDPYHMAVNAVDEALRNLTAVGGDITHTAILDNFCWGNSTDPQQLGMLVRAVKGCYDAVLGFGTPFISGKDSLNNEYRTHGKRLPVIPTLLISAVGRIDDAAQTIDMSLKTPGNLLYLVGTTRNELADSYYTEVIDQRSFATLLPYTTVPQVDIPHAYATMKALGEAIRQGLVRACHDLSEGGLALAAAEMSLASLLGVTLDLHHISIEKHSPHPPSEGDEQIDEPDVFPVAVDIVRLFSESPSRFLAEIAPEQLGTFEKYMRINGVADIIYVGTVSHTDRFIVRDGEEELINLGVSELQEAWKGGKS